MVYKTKEYIRCTWFWSELAYNIPKPGQISVLAEIVVCCRWVEWFALFSCEMVSLLSFLRVSWLAQVDEAYKKNQ